MTLVRITRITNQMILSLHVVCKKVNFFHSPETTNFVQYATNFCLIFLLIFVNH